MVTPDILILARDPSFGPALTRLVDLALDVKVTCTESELEVEDELSNSTPVIIMESEGRPEDYALLLRAWRIRPEAPIIICAPANTLEGHRAFGPIGLIPSPPAPGSLIRLLRRALYCRRWIEDSAATPVGLPSVLPVQMAPVDVMHMLRRDVLTFNVWREAANPGFHRPGWTSGAEQMPEAAHALQRAFLPRSDLSRANFTRMSLYGASLRESSGIFTQLEGADLRDCDLASVLFVGADLAGADLRGANLERAEFIACDLTGAYLDPDTLQHVLLVDCEVDSQPKKASRSPSPA